MKTSEIQIRVDTSLNTARALLRHQDGEITWEEFIGIAMIEFSKQPSSPTRMDSYFEWLNSQKDNTASNSSSGSLMSGLIDIDNMFRESELEESYDEITEYYNSQIYSIR